MFSRFLNLQGSFPLVKHNEKPNFLPKYSKTPYVFLVFGSERLVSAWKTQWKTNISFNMHRFSLGFSILSASDLQISFVKPTFPARSLHFC